MKFFKSARNLISIIARHPKFFAFAAFIFLVLAPVVAYAQYSLETHQKAIDASGQNLQKFGQQELGTFFNSANTFIIGCQSCNDPSLKTGALQTTTNMIAGLYANPPASGVTYFADVMQRLNPVQSAYAQTVGTGFSALTPLLPVWKAFRNFAYVFFTIVFIFIGLAIMFRMKLDPRTTLTIQSAIPRIVVALLLVTFSYAIAGLLIDLLYLLIALVAAIFGGVTGFDAKTLQTDFLNGGFPQVIYRAFAVVGSTGLSGATTLGVASLITTGVAALLAGTATGAGAFIVLGAALPALILLVIILYLLFRLFMELLKAYIMIVILIILAPLQIALGAIPGMPGFGAWFKNIMANILVFPAVAFILLVAQAVAKTSGQGIWTPPMVSGNVLGLNALPLLIGLGFLLVVHQVPQVIKNIFGIRGLGFAVGEAFGGTPVKATYLGAAQQTINRTSGLPGWRGGVVPQVMRRMTGLRP